MTNYPASLSVDYSDKSDRLTVFFRIILAIPILIILALLTSSSYETSEGAKELHRVYSVGLVSLPALLMIVFRRKYPKWWFDWNLALVRFCTRVGTYVLLLRDEYPSTDEEQAVHIEIQYPNAATDLNQWLPLVKWFLAIPHFFVLLFIWIGVAICTVLAWFIILFTGNYPKGIFDFVVGSLRWTLRVEAYAILLTTDVYPPFSLKE